MNCAVTRSVSQPVLHSMTVIDGDSCKERSVQLVNSVH